jgi:hypothetical protein
MCYMCGTDEYFYTVQCCLSTCLDVKVTACEYDVLCSKVKCYYLSKGILKCMSI